MTRERAKQILEDLLREINCDEQDIDISPEDFTEAVLLAIDTLNSLEVENSLSEDLEEEVTDYINQHFSECSDGAMIADSKSVDGGVSYSDLASTARHFAQWQRTKYAHVPLKEVHDAWQTMIANNPSIKEVPAVCFLRGADWQKEQFEKERLKHCDALTAEQAQIESDFVVNHLKKHNRTPTFIDAIEYGMKLQKK